jgi:hypothetical protein
MGEKKVTYPTKRWEEETKIKKQEKDVDRKVGNNGGSRGKTNMVLQSCNRDRVMLASPTVYQINWASIYFWQNRKKLCSNRLASNLVNFSNLTKLPSPRVYLRAERERASGFTCKFKRGSSFLNGLFVRLAGLFLFYQVQMTNSWRESIFSLVIYFSELPNHDICQVNFDKLLEMFLVPSFLFFGPFFERFSQIGP